MKILSSPEPLEARIAPAAVFSFNDIDGDRVTIKTSLGMDAELKAVVTRFGGVAVDDPYQIQEIDLSANPIFAGTDLTVSVRKAGGGDGFVNVGSIDASSADGGTALDLGTVTIAGDLGQIDAGDATTTTPALKSLSVRTLGAYALLTQNNTGNLTSDIQGSLGALKVTGDVKDAYVHVTGTLGPVTIGGSVLGGTVLLSGTIQAGGNIGAVKIGGSLEGGTGISSGRLQSDTGLITSVTLGGSLLGGEGTGSGSIRSSHGLGPIKITGSVIGNLGASSGLITGSTSLGPDDGALTSVTIGGTLQGGPGTGSGAISSPAGIGPIKIGHDVSGGAGDDSGKIFSAGKITSLTIGGSVVGGRGNQNGDFTHIGQIHADDGIGDLTIAGSLIGGSDPNIQDTTSFGGDSGAIYLFGSLGRVKIGGSILGGSGDESGFIRAQNVTSITIGGSVIGGDCASHSGALFLGTVGAMKIGGDFLAGGGVGTGTIQATDITSLTIGGSMSGDITTTESIGALKIGGDLLGVATSIVDDTGPTTSESGYINVGIAFNGGHIGSLTIGGSIIGASASTGALGFAGSIRADGDIGPIKIGGDLRSGSITGSAFLRYSAYIESGGRITSVTIGGSIIAGTDTSSSTIDHSASIRAVNEIGAVSIKGSLLGTASAPPIVISAGGQKVPGRTLDLAIKSVTIGGRVERAEILAGFTPFDAETAASNGNASIGPVKVSGDWVASSISAGVKDGGAAGFGTTGDTVAAKPAIALTSRIASITIRGFISGSATVAGDHFGFAAQQIGTLRAAGYLAPLTAATNNPIELSPITSDVTVREI